MQQLTSSCLPKRQAANKAVWLKSHARVCSFQDTPPPVMASGSCDSARCCIAARAWSHGAEGVLVTSLLAQSSMHIEIDTD
jgi:hypothetical protein